MIYSSDLSGTEIAEDLSNQFLLDSFVKDITKQMLTDIRTGYDKLNLQTEMLPSAFANIYVFESNKSYFALIPSSKNLLSVISIASWARFLIILIVVPMLVVFRTSGDTRCTPTQTRRGEVPSRERIRLHLQKPGPSFTAKTKR